MHAIGAVKALVSTGNDRDQLNWTSANENRNKERSDFHSLRPKKQKPNGIRTEMKEPSTNGVGQF